MTGEGGAEIHSVPVVDWAQADRLRWEAVCRPGQRGKRGGAAAQWAQNLA